MIPHSLNFLPFFIKKKNKPGSQTIKDNGPKSRNIPFTKSHLVNPEYFTPVAFLINSRSTKLLVLKKKKLDKFYPVKVLSLIVFET
jgi:hypothetical protein